MSADPAYLEPPEDEPWEPAAPPLPFRRRSGAPTAAPDPTPSRIARPGPRTSNSAGSSSAASSSATGAPTSAGAAPHVPAIGSAAQAASTIARALAEVLQGVRPPHQLAPWMDHDTFEKIRRRAVWEREAMIARGETPADAWAQVLGCHVQAVIGGCECTATLSLRGRVRALCFRLETHRSRWRAVALELG